jgi:hypothetical protein
MLLAVRNQLEALLVRSLWHATGHSVNTARAQQLFACARTGAYKQKLDRAFQQQPSGMR